MFCSGLPGLDIPISHSFIFVALGIGGRKYTLYDQIGTPKLGQYQNSGKINGTLDINCPGRLGQQFTIRTIKERTLEGTNAHMKGTKVP